MIVKKIYLIFFLFLFTACPTTDPVIKNNTSNLNHIRTNIKNDSKRTVNNKQNTHQKTLKTPKGMVLVKGGDFMMGDTFGDGTKDEIKRKVKLKSFFISKKEVTFKEFDQFSKETNATLPKDLGWGRGERPVIFVSWIDALKFCNWKSKKENLKPVYRLKNNQVFADFSANGYRLPTEAEWEYAAKGGHKSKGYRLSGGNDPLKVAWYEKNSNKRTHPVGQKKPNELGIYDMSGNVFEWTWDSWNKKATIDSKKIYDNPKGPAETIDKVLKGGSWDLLPWGLRPSFRGHEKAYKKDFYIGFRVVRNTK